MGKLGSSSGVAPYQLPTSFAARFEQRFSIEMQLRQRAQRRIGRLSPEAALGRFEQAFGHRVERPRIAGGQKTPDTWVKRIAEIVTRAAAGEAVNRCDHAAMKLEIVIAIEEVMFTVVLIMQRDVD